MTNIPKESARDSSATAQKQKLDCALQLARSVSLDFKNVLTSILGQTSFLLSQIEAPHPWREALSEIEKSAERAAEIVSDLAAFSHQEKDTNAQTTGNLNALARGTVDLFRAPANKDVFWKLECENKLFSAKFDDRKIQQAFLKIIENAIQAMDHAGQIVVTTANHQFSEPFKEGTISLAPGVYVSVGFRDSGPGMTPEVLAKVFEPFFTTKPNPPHRGLGLVFVYGIVSNHGGGVAISSQPGHGTSVRIYLPAEAKIIADRPLNTSDLRGSQTILLIDDDESILTMSESVLSAYGYRVLIANNGEKGIALFLKCVNEIDLVITDLVMPQMSGRQVMAKIFEASPQARVLLASGVPRAEHDDEKSYLSKPFNSTDLLKRVKQTLLTSNSPL